MLYLVATPIGHLGDITYRAVEILRSCHYVLCEDTRHSAILLNHYGIDKPLKSYHKFNEARVEKACIEDLKSGMEIALLCDAGSPGICDPAERLVRRCLQETIKVRTAPGPCALIAALTISGMPTSPFQFLGFIPKTASKKKAFLISALCYRGTTLCYETPHQIIKTLESLHSLDPLRPLSLLRELTKIHEEHLFANAATLLSHFQVQPPRGEMVLLIAPSDPLASFASLSSHALVDFLQKTYSLSLKEAIKIAAELGSFSKKELYKAHY